MDAMADAIRRAGGQVLTGTDVTAIDAPDARVSALQLSVAGQPHSIATSQLIVSAPPGVVARTLNPVPAPGVVPPQCACVRCA
jgi:phytoene dehydrogenase-like protein